MSGPVGIVREPFIKAVIGGRVVKASGVGTGHGGTHSVGAGVLAASCAYGFDLQVAEATITCTGKPSWSVYGDPVQLFLQADKDLTQPARFVGSVVEFDYTYSPVSVDVLCRGYLYNAQRFQVAGGNVSSPTPDPFPANGGVDLSGNKAGRSDQDIVSSILRTCGVPGYVGHIGGVGALFGSVIPESCRWAENQSGLDAINQFDTICLGWRTYDVPGMVVRTQVSATPSGVPVATFVEGLDIFSGQAQYGILNTLGVFVVTGGTKKGKDTAYHFTLAGSNPYNRSPEQTSSALLEKSAEADAGAGLSCEAVAGWRRAEMDRPLAQIGFTTPRGDYLQPGQTIRILSDWRMGATAQLYWVQRVDNGITENGVYTQALTCIGAAL